MSAREYAGHVYAMALQAGATYEEAERAARAAYDDRKKVRR